MRYGAGLPTNRIERLQFVLGVPPPASTQWELLLEAAGLLTQAELIRPKPQGRVLNHDATVMRIPNRTPPSVQPCYTGFKALRHHGRIFGGVTRGCAMFLQARVKELSLTTLVEFRAMSRHIKAVQESRWAMRKPEPEPGN